MTEKMIISPLLHDEIMSLNSLQPAGWLDIRDVFYLHSGKNYFSAYKGLINGELASVGHIINCWDVAWLGNVIVHPSHRNKGWGTDMTKYLIEKVQEGGISTIYLLATDLGKPIYEKLGFIHHGDYTFNNIQGEIFSDQDDPRIRKSDVKDRSQIWQLDQEAMAYDRSEVLEHFLGETWVFDDGLIRGFYIRGLGDGLIIASDQVAGWALSIKRIRDGKTHLVIPNQQQVPLSELHETNNFYLNQQARIAYFMFQGQPPDYRSSMIYSRIGGYLG